MDEAGFDRFPPYVYRGHRIEAWREPSNEAGGGTGRETAGRWFICIDDHPPVAAFPYHPFDREVDVRARVEYRVDEWIVLQGEGKT